MLDVSIIRARPDEVRLWQRCRGLRVEAVDDFLDVDAKWKELRTAMDNQLFLISGLSREVSKLMRADRRTDACILIENVKNMRTEAATLKEEVEQRQAERDSFLREIGNELLHYDLEAEDCEPEARDTTTAWAEQSDHMCPAEHVLHSGSLLGSAHVLDGSTVGGTGALFLQGPLVLLNLALLTYTTTFVGARGYTLIQGPSFMKKRWSSPTHLRPRANGTCLEVRTSSTEMLAVSSGAQSAVVLHHGEWLHVDTLPRRYGSISVVFGNASEGPPQSEEVSLSVFASPDESGRCYEELQGTIRSYLASLGLPFREVPVHPACLDLSDAHAQRFEVPLCGTHVPVGLAAHCTDYQARDLGIRARATTLRTKAHAHTLHAVLCPATHTLLRCLLEGATPQEGLVVPEVLRNFMGGQEVIPFAALSECLLRSEPSDP